MTDRNTKQREDQAPAGKPSQAEGERNPGATRHDSQEGAAGKPSQAEGDRATIDEKLRDFKNS